MTQILSPTPVQRFVDNNGNALTGGKLFTYAAGTTTKLATYTDPTLNTPNTDPIILNSRGEAGVWLVPGTNYKFVLSPATDSDPPSNPIWTVDDISFPGGGGCLDITNFGGAAGGILDNTNAWNLMIGAQPACLHFPPGKFVFNSAISFTLPALPGGIATVTIEGSGTDATELTWPNPVGAAITLTMLNTNSSVHVKNLTISTSTNKMDDGLVVTTTQVPSVQTAVNNALSTIENVTFRGSDGYAVNAQWSRAVHLLNAGGFGIYGVTIFGANGGLGGWGTAAQGDGLVIEGTGFFAPVIFNITVLTAYMLNNAILIGNNIQGVTISQSNFTGVNTGVGIPPGVTGLSQLVVSDSQFNCSIGINALATCPGLAVHDNLFILQASPPLPMAINLIAPAYTVLADNTISGTGNGGVGFQIAANFPGAAGGTITGNMIFALTIGIACLAGAKRFTIASNNYWANIQDIVSDIGANAIDVPMDCTAALQLLFGNSNTGMTYFARGASYYQIGKEVVVTINIGLLSKGSSTGVAAISGLPVISTSANEFGSLIVNNYSGLSGANGITGFVGQGSNLIALTIPGASSCPSATDANFTNNTVLVGTVIYRAA